MRLASVHSGHSDIRVLKKYWESDIELLDPRADGHQHVVMFYGDDEVLVDAIIEFLNLGQGGTAIVVATRAHRDALEKRLASIATNTDPTLRPGRYVALDADDLLDEFVREGAPSEARFLDLLGRMIDSIGPGPVRIFGEMVALLWDRGNVAAALEVESLWNRLARSHHFDLFCAYPVSALDGDASVDAFQRMCGAHNHLIPFSG